MNKINAMLVRGIVFALIIQLFIFPAVRPTTADAAGGQELLLPTTNLVTNPGFEEDKAGWDVEWEDTKAEITTDAHSGEKALKVQASSLEQTLPIQPGKSYKLEFFAKREGPPDSNALGINFWDVPGMGRQGVLTEVDSEGYQQYELFFEAPAQFSSATLVIYKIAGEGSVYADDFLLTELTNLVTNPGFEEDKAGWDVEWEDTKAEITTDAHSGEKALRVQESSLEQTLPIQPGKSYKLEFYAKREGPPDSNALGINFWDVPGLGRQGVLTEVDSAEYQKYELFFEAPAQFSSATLVIYKIGGAGSVYADDFYLTEAPSQKDDDLPAVDKYIPVEESKTTPKLILMEKAFVDNSGTPAQIQKNIDHIDSLPFDGILISPDIRLGLMRGKEVTYEEIYEELKVLKGLFNNLKDNYLQINISRPYHESDQTDGWGDVFVDEAWDIVEQNFKNYARAAKEVGIHNFLFDNEEYWFPFLDHPRLSFYKDKTLKEYEDKTRQRGKELMNAILGEIPDARIVHLHGPYLSDKKMPTWFNKGELPYWNLYGPLFVGMMEAVVEGGNQGAVIDGGELYSRRSEGDFMDAYQYRKYEMPSFQENKFIPEYLRESYPSTVKISFGLYTHHVNNAYPMSPEIMRSTLEYALRTSEEMVWFYHEPEDDYGNWLVPGDVDETWFNSVIEGRKAVEEKLLGTNRIYNSGFELGKVNWDFYGSAERKATVKSMKVSYSSAVGLSLNQRVGGAKQQLTNLLGGRAYELSAWAQVLNANDKAQIGIIFKDDQSQIITEHSFDINTSAYSKGSMTFIAPAQFSEAEVYVKREAGSDYIFVDDVFLREWIGAPTSMKINMDTTNLKVGENLPMVISGLDAQGKEIALNNTDIQLASTDASVAEISAKGKLKSVKAIKPGKVKVVANTVLKGIALQAEAEITVSEQSTGSYVPVTSGPGAQPQAEPQVKPVSDAEGNLVVDLGKDLKEALVSWDQLGKLAAEGRSLIFTDGEMTATLTADGIKALWNQVAEKDRNQAGLWVSLQALPQQIASKRLAQAELNTNAKLTPQGSIRELSLSVQSNGKEVTAVSLPQVRVSLPLQQTGNHKLTGVYGIDDKGNLEFMGGTVQGGRIETQLANVNSSFAAILLDKQYVDVPASHWALNVIKEMSAKHLLQDTGAKLFPEEEMTRAQYIAMLAQALNLGESTTIPFHDVADGAWYAGWVAKAVEEGLVNGYGNGAFGPDDIIQREQMAVILVRAYEWKTKKSIQTSGYSDYSDREKISNWALNAVDAATEIGLLQGKSNRVFDPQHAVTRAESIMAIYSMLQKLQSK
ncbi:S-layer homology domain-containing protein [Paenibacillus eucommiae]|uniref:SLH domain-containing protein n=1 Tax=Paenibacillus eucommiae TaxID=1355755 RepID=A0ABS4ILS1_9BACL|nr:S-layer homology domain-containing protein [Paenibacillus eucommiae]MBP1988523.1 hypothetical protein [Paenibacillus eucommiae]